MHDAHIKEHAVHLVRGGASTREAAKACGLCQSIVARLCRGLSRYTSTPGIFQEFMGVRYYFESATGYWRSHDRSKGRPYMHRVVFELHHGQIPDGHDVHHKDEDKSNNSPKNLESKNKHWHQRHHMAQRKDA